MLVPLSLIGGPVPFLPGPQYLALPRAPLSWVVRGILPTSGLLNIFGEPKAGKSYLSLDLALAIADERRTHFCEWEVVTHGTVWYLQIDTPRGLFHEDYLERAVKRGMDLHLVEFCDQMMAPYPFNILGDGKEMLRRDYLAAAKKPVAVIIDTLRDSHGADENDSGVMRNVVTSFVDAFKPEKTACGPDCSDLCSCRTPPALVFLSHQKKMATDEQVNLMSANRGSNYLAGRMDAVMRVAEGDIRAQSRSMPLTTLSDYKRDVYGFWIKFDQNREIDAYLARQKAGEFPSEHAMHKAFAEQWKCSVGGAKNWFDNFRERHSYDRYPPKP